MTEINLTQAEADGLLAMKKQRADEEVRMFPRAGEHIAIPLLSSDKREEFILDVSRGRIKLAKVTYQNRARKAVVLLRLDVDGAPHENPDGEKIPYPHLHMYREGYGVKWAVAAPLDRYKNLDDLRDTLDSFMTDCNIVEPPTIQMGLF